MTLTQLLRRIGDDKLLVQPLSPINAVRRRNGDTEVTFLTDQLDPGDLLIGKPAKVGLVVWVKREDVEAATAAGYAPDPLLEPKS